MIRTSLIITVLLAVPPAGAPAAAHPCATATVRCDGTIEAPLDWDDPDSERITVGFAWLPARDRSTPARGTVLAHPGGFGADTAGVAVYQELLGPVLDHQNLLLVDMRGIGTSSPVRCDALDVRRPETIRDCAAQLGPRARYLATDQAVRDMDAVRAALGVPRVTFHGTSYGTVFAQAYAARFPERTAAVFLDAPDPIGADGYATGLLADNVGLALRDLDAVCAPSRPCRARPGTAARRLGALVSLLRATPDPAVPLAALAQLVQKKGADAVLGREINAAIDAYLAGDRAPLRRLAGPILPIVLEPGVPINPTDSAGLAYACTDVRYPFDPADPPAVRQQQLDADYAHRRPLRPFTAEEVFGPVGGAFPAWCVHWPAPRTAPPVPPGAAYPDVPALVVGGQLDGGMGTAAVESVAARFPRGVAMTVPFGGHADAFGGTARHQRCLREVMRRFLADPRRPVTGPVCGAQTYTALGAFPRDVSGDPIAAVHATVEDALGRAAPEAAFFGRAPEQAGLRGGRLLVDRAAGTVRLDRDVFVPGLTVTGTARIEDGDRATAEVTAELGGRTMHVRLDWTRLRADDPVPVTGSVDGRPFDVLVPVP